MLKYEKNQEFVQGLSKEVSDRLLKHGLKGKTVTIKVNNCYFFTPLIGECHTQFSCRF